MIDNEHETLQLLDTPSVSHITGISEQTLKRWRYERRELPFVRVGRAVRYRRCDIERWIADRTVTAEGGVLR